MTNGMEGMRARRSLKQQLCLGDLRKGCSTNTHVLPSNEFCLSLMWLRSGRHPGEDKAQGLGGSKDVGE
jgi:hypothetical protein